MKFLEFFCAEKILVAHPCCHKSILRIMETYAALVGKTLAEAAPYVCDIHRIR
jgi:hypothetical protein